MIDKVISTIRKHNMINSGDVVYAAVSGGSDSMAMLHILNAIREDIGFELRAAHVNHGIRGDDADSDESFVREYCESNSVPLSVLKADVIGEARRLGIGLEEAGRNIRYDFFSSLEEGALIATAHNLTDRAETFIFNFSRGSALRGLGSIPPVRANFIRPLIDCSKSEIEEYCYENALSFVTDLTNSDVAYSRNRIRHNVLPELRKINPLFETAAFRCIESLREDEAFLSETAERLVSDSCFENRYNTDILNSSPLPIRKRAVIRIVEKAFGVTPEYKAVDEICRILQNGGCTQINSGITVRVRRGFLDFPEEASERFDERELCEGMTVTGNAEISVSIINCDETICSQNILNNNSICFLDYDKINGKAVFRSREAGDRITLRKRRCTKTLKKLLNELSVAPEKRDSIIILADESGVLFAEGIGANARAEVSSSTRRILKIEINRMS